MTNFAERGTSAPSIWGPPVSDMYQTRVGTDDDLAANPYAPVADNVLAASLAYTQNHMTSPGQAAEGAAVRRREAAERAQARQAGARPRTTVAEAATPTRPTTPEPTAPPLSGGLSLGGGVSLGGVTELPQGERPGTPRAAAEETQANGDPRTPQPSSPLTAPIMNIVNRILPAPTPDPLQPMPDAYLPRSNISH